MELDILLNEMIEMIEVSKDNNISASLLIFFYKDKWLYITQEKIDAYNTGLELVYNSDEKIQDRFSRETIYKHINDEVFRKRNNNNNFTKADKEIFFKIFLDQKPKECKVMAPISGIRLDTEDLISISVFEIGKADSLDLPLNYKQSDYYITVKLKNVYDDKLAIKIAEEKFSDFIRLITFISGKEDKSIYMKVGLPVYADMGQQKMYVDTSSYRIIENDDSLFGAISINNKIVEKLPLDNPHFKDNINFRKLWDIYDQPDTRNNKMNKRLLNASIAIGESALSKNTVNSIIYTSMAFEMLFSLDERSLFQASIADKLASHLAFIVCTDRDSRLSTIKDVKKFYGLRSALVHGSNPTVNSDYIMFNILLRTAISELLNNSKYENMKNIENLYEMLKEAQNSY